MWWDPRKELPVPVVARHHLKCSTNWVHELIRRGILTANRYGPRKTTVTKDSLERYLAQWRDQPYQAEPTQKTAIG